MTESSRCDNKPTPTPSEVVETAFPLKLHTVLEESEKQGFEDVISWRGNKAFMVHKPKKFEGSIMKEYFNQIQYKGFQKQLELHGFARLAVGEIFGGSYTHGLFVRGKPNMVHLIKPITNKSKKIKMRPRHGRSRSDSSGLCLSTRPRAAPAPRFARRRKQVGVSSFLPESIVPAFRESSSSSLFEDDLEPLRHDRSVPRIVEYDGHDRRTTKKHRSNNSWSPVIRYPSSSRSSSVEAVEWLSSVWGGIENSSSSPRDEPLPVEDKENDELFHKIIDVGDEDNDTLSIYSFSVHSFSSLHNSASMPRPSDEDFGSENSESKGGENGSLRVLDASLEVLRSARGLM